jgi:hypothetical protein
MSAQSLTRSSFKPLNVSTFSALQTAATATHSGAAQKTSTAGPLSGGRVFSTTTVKPTSATSPAKRPVTALPRPPAFAPSNPGILSLDSLDVLGLDAFTLGSTPKVEKGSSSARVIQIEAEKIKPPVDSGKASKTESSDASATIASVTSIFESWRLEGTSSNPGQKRPQTAAVDGRRSEKKEFIKKPAYSDSDVDTLSNFAALGSIPSRFSKHRSGASTSRYISKAGVV